LRDEQKERGACGENQKHPALDMALGDWSIGCHSAGYHARNKGKDRMPEELSTMGVSRAKFGRASKNLIAGDRFLQPTSMAGRNLELWADFNQYIRCEEECI
jgi:hypothetical protein